MGALFKIKNLPASINSVYINGREIKLGELESANEVYTSWDLTHGRLKALEDFLYQYQILKNDCAGELTLYNN
jgi:hypothetical protein